MVSGILSIHQFGHSDMTSLVVATAKLLELYMWKRRPFISTSDLVTVSYATGRGSKPSSEAPYWQMIQTYWNTAMQQNNIWCKAFEPPPNEILKDVC